MRHTNISSILFLTVLLFSMASCRRVFERAKWTPEASFPIAYSDLTISDFLTDSSVVKEDSAGLVSVYFSQNLDSLSLSVLDTFSAPPFNRKFKLDSLRLEVPVYDTSYTLGYFARRLMQSPNPQNQQYGFIILFMHGKKLSEVPFPIPLPPKVSVPVGSVPLSLNNVFETAELRTGKVDLTIENRFPLDIDRLDFSISNAGNNMEILNESGIRIPKSTSFNRTYDLAGKIVEGDLMVNIPVMDLIVDRDAVIDTNSEIRILMEFSDLSVTSATAVFPDQDVVTDRQAVSLENMRDLELKEAVIEEGNLVMDVKSTIKDSIFITYIMPKAYQNGVPLVFRGVVPPATSTQSVTTRLKVPVKDYLVNFSYPPDYFNRFLYDFKASVKYTGRKVSLNLQDSIEINVYLKSVRPKYVRGYLGSLDTTISSSVKTEAFSQVKAERFAPETVKLSLIAENSLGVAGTVELEKLTATNASGASAEATDAELIGKPLTISPATDPPFRQTITTLNSSEGSDFASLVSILPDKLDYTVHLSVGGQRKDTNNFVYNTSRLKPSIRIEAPLKVSVKGLVLKDTVPVNTGQVETESGGGVLRLMAYNGFPFSATVSLNFIDKHGNQQPAKAVGIMEAADTDPVTGRVKEKKFSKIEFRFSEDELNFVLISKQLVVEAVFNTPSDKKAGIYSDYSAQLTLTAKASPQITR